mmetsp:Transcript_68458/g.108712  ORF Transcript_68458/g.108712 Transcript_68458/m.108712 type:complete len:88 (-) Transcript_68458:427-690(-)
MARIEPKQQEKNNEDSNQKDSDPDMLIFINSLQQKPKERTATQAKSSIMPIAHSRGVRIKIKRSKDNHTKRTDTFEEQTERTLELCS